MSKHISVTMADKNPEDKQHSGLLKNHTLVVRAVASTMMGAVFGFSMQKGRVFEPENIRAQMVMEKFIMMKMFLSAIAAGQLTLWAGSYFFPRELQQAKAEFDLTMRDKTPVRVGIGAAILGAGMTVSGACPGMILIQVGSRVPNALVTLTGIFAGTLLYATLHPTICNAFVAKAKEHHRLDLTHGLSYRTTAFLMSTVLVGACAGLEYFVPWTSEVPVADLSSMWHAYAWPPLLCGALVGLIQVPAVYFLRDTLGGSSAYVTCCSQLFSVMGGDGRLDYLRDYRNGFASWWQVFYVGTAMAGAAMAHYLSKGPVPSGVSAEHAFLGGVMLAVGARMAGGCTSGHGLSGMALLANNSFVAVPAMFAGAMGVAFCTSLA